MARFIQRLLPANPTNGLGAQLIRGVMGVGGLKLLSLALTLLTTVVLARGLGPVGFGQYSFVVSLITVLSIPLGPAPMLLTTREVAAYRQKGDDKQIFALLKWTNRNVWYISAVLILILATYATSQANWHKFDRWTLVAISLLALPFLGLSQVRTGTLTGMKHMVLAQLPEQLARPVFLLFVFAALISFKLLNPLNATVAFAGAAIIAYLIGDKLLLRVFPACKSTQAYTSEQAKKWRAAWIPFMLLVAAGTLNTQIGIIFLGWLSTDDQVAALRVAERGAMLVALSITVINIVIGPHITEAFQSGNKLRLNTLFRQSARIALLTAIPVALPFIFFGKPILAMVFGAEYAILSSEPLLILTVGRLINVAFGAVGMFLAMSGFERDTTFGHLTALIINAAASLILVPKYGATGAAIATVTGLTFWTITLSFLAYKRLKIKCTPF